VFNPTTVAQLIADINTANTNADPDTINLAGLTFVFTAVDNTTNGDNALPTILADGGNALTINGGGATLQRSSAGGTPLFRLLQVNGGTLNLDGVTVQNGNSGSFRGGGVRVQSGVLNLTNSTLTGNTSGAINEGGGLDVETGGIANLTGSLVSGNTGYRGAGIASYGTLTIAGGSVTGNTASGSGGGVGVFNGSATITSATIAGNTASLAGDFAGGGGVFSVSGSTLTLTGRTVSGNTAGSNAAGSTGFGGGLDIRGAATLLNCTISGNTVNGPAGQFGGGGIGISTVSAVQITNCTITDNHDLSGQGGGGLHSYTGSTNVTLRNTIIAGNTTTSGGGQVDLLGIVLAASVNNLIGNGTGGSLVNNVNGNQVGSAGTPLVPGLGALANNGGPTLTHALVPGSLAIDRGSNGAVTGVLTDQRGTGFNRISGGAGLGVVDIGAFEAQAVVFTSANNATFTVGTNGTFLVTTTSATPVAFTLAGGLPAGVTFVDNGNGTATFSGIPAAGSSGAFALQITANNGTTATQVFTLTVQGVAQPATKVKILYPKTFVKLANGFLQGTFTVTNRTSKAIPGPITLAFANLPPGVTVKSQTFVAKLGPLQAARITVVFENPNNAYLGDLQFKFPATVLAG